MLCMDLGRRRNEAINAELMRQFGSSDLQEIFDLLTDETFDFTDELRLIGKAQERNAPPFEPATLTLANLPLGIRLQHGSGISPGQRPFPIVARCSCLTVFFVQLVDFCWISEDLASDSTQAV